jgi:23S rRNA (adenine2503-C2)-methyltransferase
MSWLYQKGAVNIDDMTNLSLPLREELKLVACLSFLKPNQVLESKDGAKKYLFSLEDGEMIESVLIPEKGRYTLCISTQLGCALKCRFCLTGKRGLVRNLTTAEIVGQVGAVLTHLEDKGTLKNIVLMGMGEPLNNYENTLKALEIIFHPHGFYISYRRVTLSSAGVIPILTRLGRESKVNLAISLNSADNETRSFLMPINRKYPLSELIAALKDYPLPPRKRITFEYILIAGVNDSLRDAQKLIDLLRPLRCKINLIPFNEHQGVDFKRPTQESIDSFRDFLIDHHYTTMVRESRGKDISAACGQLGGTHG